jgi:sugar/nucleoside kinase (ribokinase family)
VRRTYDAVVAGHICLDVIPDLSASPREGWQALFRPGHLLEVGPVTLCTGGPVSNTGLALQKLGIRTRLMGKVGEDLMGRAVLEVIASHGADLVEGMVVEGTADSSYTVIISPPGVDRFFLHCPGANDTFDAGDVRYAVVAKALLFHFGYPPLMRRMFENGGTELVTMFKQVKQLGVTTSLDMAVPDPTSPAGYADWVSILRAVLPYVDLFLPSIEETLYMLRRETYEQLAQETPGEGFLSRITPALLSDVSHELLELGARVVGLKLGHRGLYARTGARSAIEGLGTARPSDPAAWADKELWSPCFQVEVVGTTGAGDATIAGFLSGLLRDMSFEETLTVAVAVGACNTEAADALSGVRSWKETWRRVNGGWARHVLRLDAPGWYFDDQAQLWVGPAGSYG